jgi:hypothetical protein
MNQVIIFNKVNGMEFYTDIQSGRSGINLIGLSLLCRISVDDIWQLIESRNNNEKFSSSECLLTYQNCIYCNDTLSRFIIIHYAFYHAIERNNIDLLKEIIKLGFNEWVADLTGWKKKYTRFNQTHQYQKDQPITDYQRQMENAYQLQENKSFLESCLKLKSC